MVLKHRTKPTDPIKTIDPNRPICCVCGKEIPEEFRFAKVRERGEKEGRHTKIKIPPLKIGVDLFRCRRDSCEPGSKKYMEKFGPVMNPQLKRVFERGKNGKKEEEGKEITFETIVTFGTIVEEPVIEEAPVILKRRRLDI